MKKSLVALACLMGFSACALNANAEVETFKIVGERVDYPIPSMMKLAYMTGSPTGEYLVEYVDKSEDVEHWKKYLVSQQRIHDNFKNTILRTIQGIQQKCPNLKASRLLKAEKRDIQDFVSWIYFCPDKMPQAPYGEGAVMSFIAGDSYSFKLWTAWRPQQADLGENGMGISQKSLNNFLLLKSLTYICNPEQGKDCQQESLLP